MSPELIALIEAAGFDLNNLTENQVAYFEAQLDDEPKPPNNNP